MTIQFNVTGKERKRLVAAISERRIIGIKWANTSSPKTAPSPAPTTTN